MNLRRLNHLRRLRDFWRLALFVGLGVAAPSLRADGPARRGASQHRLIECNDGGTLGAPDAEAPIGMEGLVRETIDPLRDTMVDTLYWQLGVDPYFGTKSARLSDWYLHNTKVGPIWGAGREQFKTAGEWRIAENGRSLLAAGMDPPAVVIAAGHKAGLDVFLSLRINDGHDSMLPNGLDDQNMSPLRRAHRGWLLGKEAASVPGGPANFTRFAYDFAIPEVRQYLLALAEEAIGNYDADGFDLDFCREPSLFKMGETEQGRPWLTRLMRDIRHQLDAKGRQTGRKLYFSVRVPPNLIADRAAGIDVADWIEGRLVDLVVVGERSGWNYRLPIEPFVALARGTGCKIIAQNLCAFREDRGRSATVLFGEGSYYTTEQFRAVAAIHWQAGADGQFIWNQHWLRFTANSQFDRQSWKEIGDPGVLRHKNKHYLTNPRSRGGPLPVELNAAGEHTEINVEIADDPGDGRRSGFYARATLRLLIEQLTNLDDLSLTLNGLTLDRAKARVRLNYNDCWLDFDVTDTIKRGQNRLALGVEKRNSHVAAPLLLRSVETLVTYE